MKTNNSHKFFENNCNSSHFSTGTLSFHASQQIKPGDDISLSVDPIKHFLGKSGERYTLQNKSNASPNSPKSQDVSANEITENITTTDDKQIDKTESVHKVLNEENLLSLFDQYSDLMSSTSD